MERTMMCSIILATVAFGFLATSAHADTMKNCADAWVAMSPADKAKTSYPAYSAVCLKKDVKANAVPAAPADATAVCNDGTYSKSKTAQGRCSGHQGVAKVLDVTPDSDSDD